MTIINNSKYCVETTLFNDLIEAIGMYDHRVISEEISLYLTNDKEMIDLNRKYFGKKANTDVLSFSNEFREAPILGEIVINLDFVMKEDDHDRYLKRVFVHGVVHLLGYDHINSREKLLMNEIEEKILKRFEL